MKRSRLGRGESKSVFRRTAGAHRKNFSMPMRGGIRL